MEVANFGSFLVDWMIWRWQGMLGKSEDVRVGFKCPVAQFFVRTNHHFKLELVFFFEPPVWKNMLVKLDHFSPGIRMKIQKKLKPPPGGTGFKDHLLGDYLPTGWARLWLTDFEPKQKSRRKAMPFPCRGRSCWVISSCRWVDEVWPENAITMTPTYRSKMEWDLTNGPQSKLQSSY